MIAAALLLSWISHPADYNSVQAVQPEFPSAVTNRRFDANPNRWRSISPVETEAQATQQLLSNRNFDDGLAHWISGGKNSPEASIADDPAKKFSHLLKLDVNSSDANPWDSQIGQSIEQPIASGDVLYLRTSMRCPNEPVSVSLVFEEAQPPNNKDIYETVRPTKEWQEFSIPVRASRAYAENQSQFKFFFSGKGRVEIGDVSLENLRKADMSRLVTNLGRANYAIDNQWRKEANDRIAKLRKGSLTLQIVGKNNRPVKAGTKVQLKQLKNQFRFGTAVPASLITAKTPDSDKFREVLRKLFDTVTFENDMKWYNYPPNYIETNVYPAMDWLKKQGIEIRGHTLMWGSYRNSQTLDPKLDGPSTWKLIEAHVRDYAAKMKGKVYIWDVVNEAVSETEIWDKVGWDKFAECYKIARQVDPKAELCYNDYNITTVDGHRAAAIARANQIRAAGAPIDVFGDQSHLSAPGVAPRTLWRVWDEVNTKTQLPIEITEFDFSSRDDDFQANYIEDFYRAAFAHPKMKSLILWGFWEKAHWLANRSGHLVNADWTWRPAMKTIERLVTKEWRTQGTFTTNSKGEVTVPAFYGQFELSVGSEKAKFGHPKAGTRFKLKLKK